MGRGSGSWGCPLAHVIHPVGAFPWRQEEVPLLVLIRRTHFWLAWWIPVHNSPKVMSVPGLQMRKQSHQHHPARQQLKCSLAFSAAALSSPQSLPACCCSTFSPLGQSEKHKPECRGISVLEKQHPPRHRDTGTSSTHTGCQQLSPRSLHLWKGQQGCPAVPNQAQPSRCGVPISPPQPPTSSSTEMRLKRLSNDTLIGTRKYQVPASLLGDSGMKVRSRLYIHKATLKSHCHWCVP